MQKAVRWIGRWTSPRRSGRRRSCSPPPRWSSAARRPASAGRCISAPGSPRPSAPPRRSSATRTVTRNDSLRGTMSDLRSFDEIAATDTDTVGGKGQSLGVLFNAGLPVPPGFCVTSAAYRRLAGRPPRDEPDLAAAVADAYRRLGGGPVAVRSSATAEDGAVTSFAGQQETVLGVTGTDAVCAAVARCWASLDSERAAAYRRKQGVSDDGLAMAVVVQRLVNAEVAGVLFTRDPLDVTGTQMLVEASWGLGESVVSGRVHPDRFHLDRATGKVLDRHIS